MSVKTIRVFWAFNTEAFGKTLKGKRTEAKLTTAQVGELTGLAGGTISVLERAMNPNPEVNTIFQLCDLFEIDPREYMEVRTLAELQ